MASLSVTVGVLALQGAFHEHIQLLRQAASLLTSDTKSTGSRFTFTFTQVRTAEQLAACDALILPGGESTTMSLVAERSGLLEPLREYVKVKRLPVWGTCAGLILLAESANRTKQTGQELIGGLDVRVHRNYFGRQTESFEAELDLPFLGPGEKFRSVFIRAPVVEEVLSPRRGEQGNQGAVVDTVVAPSRAPEDESRSSVGESVLVEVMARLPGRAQALKDATVTAGGLGEDGDIVAVRQGNVFGTSFHPELTGDARIHAWWLGEVVGADKFR